MPPASTTALKYQCQLTAADLSSGSGWAGNAKPWAGRRLDPRRARGLGELAGAAGADEHDLALGQLQLLGVLARQLGLEPLAVLQDQVGPDLEAQVDEPLDHGLGGGAVGLAPDLDVVGPDEQL